jgi:uncharacterized protein YuzE
MAAKLNIDAFLKLIPQLRDSPERALWASYDAEADTLYVNFSKVSRASDGELTDDDVIVRYDDGKVVGFTVLHASQR